MFVLLLVFEGLGLNLLKILCGYYPRSLRGSSSGALFVNERKSLSSSYLILKGSFDRWDVTSELR
jgi:hypothetical protein